MDDRLKSYEDEREYLDEISKHNKNTHHAYLSAYNKLRSVIEKPLMIRDAPQDFLIQAVKDVSESAQTRNIVLSVLFRLREGLNNAKLELYRIQNNKKRNRDTIARQAEELKKYEHVTYFDLVNYTDAQYKDKNYVSHIVNYLLTHKNVRNQDVNVYITSDKSDDLTGNYLQIINGSRVRYVRNNYKTFATYGKKVIDITTKSFVKSVKELHNEYGDNYYILGEGIKPTSLTKKITSYTMLGMTEASMFKVILKMFRDDADILKNISDNRGTSLDVIVNEYDVIS